MTAERSVYFDSASSEGFGANVVPVGAPPLTIFAWIYFESEPGSDAVPMSMARSSTNTDYVSFWLDVSTNRLRGEVRGSTQEVTLPTTNYTTGRWYFVAVRYAGSLTDIWFDGAQQDTEAGSPTLTLTRTAVGFEYRSSPQRYFTGEIFAPGIMPIWAPDALLRKIEAGHHPMDICPELIRACWRMDSLRGAEDVTGNGFHLTEVFGTPQLGGQTPLVGRRPARWQWMGSQAALLRRPVASGSTLTPGEGAYAYVGAGLVEAQQTTPTTGKLVIYRVREDSGNLKHMIVDETGETEVSQALGGSIDTPSGSLVMGQPADNDGGQVRIAAAWMGSSALSGGDWSDLKANLLTRFFGINTASLAASASSNGTVDVDVLSSCTGGGAWPFTLVEVTQPDPGRGTASIVSQEVRWSPDGWNGKDAGGNDVSTVIRYKVTSAAAEAWGTVICTISGVSYADEVAKLGANSVGWWKFTESEDTFTAQAFGASTVTFEAGASASNDFYNGWRVYTRSGPGAGQYATVTDYVGSTKIATVDITWDPVGDATTVCERYLTAADTETNQDATLHGLVTLGRQSIAADADGNTSLLLTGESAFIEIPHFTEIDDSGNGDAFVLHVMLQSTAGQQMILSKDKTTGGKVQGSEVLDADNGRLRYYRRDSAGDAQWCPPVGGGDGTAGICDLEAHVPFAVIMSRDPVDGLAIYCDGVLVGEDATILDALVASSIPTVLGAYARDDALTDLIAHSLITVQHLIRVDRSLTASEAAALSRPETLLTFSAPLLRGEDLGELEQGEVRLVNVAQNDAFVGSPDDINDAPAGGTDVALAITVDPANSAAELELDDQVRVTAGTTSGADSFDYRLTDAGGNATETVNFSVASGAPPVPPPGATTGIGPDPTAFAAYQARTIPTGGTVRYVDASGGSNSNTGTLNAPWKTRTYALSQISGAGWTIVYRAGVYGRANGETVYDFSLSNAGTPSAPIRHMAYPGEEVWWDSAYEPFRSVGNSDWINLGGGVWESASSGYSGTQYGMFQDPSDGTWRALIPYKNTSDFNLSGNSNLGPGLIVVGGKIRIKMTLPTVAIHGSGWDMPYPSVSDPRQIGMWIYAQDRMAHFYGAHTILDGIRLIGGRTLTFIHNVDNITFRGCHFYGGDDCNRYEGDDIQFLGCTGYGGCPEWCTWRDVKVAGQKLANFKIGFALADGTSHRLRVEDCYLWDYFDGVTSTQGSPTGNRILRCEGVIWDDTIQWTSRHADLEVGWCKIYGTGPGWHGGGAASAQPGTIYFHHLLIMSTFRRVRSYGSADQLTPINRHYAAGYGAGAPCKIYHCTIIYKMPDFDGVGGGMQYIEKNQRNDTGQPHEVMNNIIVNFGATGSQREEIMEEQKWNDGSQDYDGNVYYILGSGDGIIFRAVYDKRPALGGTPTNYNDFSTYQSATGFDANSLYANPQFADNDAGAYGPDGDYRAKGTAISGAGVSLTSKGWPGVVAGAPVGALDETW